MHDRRFLDAWRRGGVEVLESPLREGDDTAQLDRELRRFAPDVVQVGPVTSPGIEVARIWDGPLIATSWGFDLMDEAARDPGSREAAARVLRRADAVFVDNDAVSARARDLGAEPERIASFPWGLSREWLDAPEPQPRAGVSVLSTRRHEDLYRVDDLVSAFEALAGSFPELDLVLAASGSETARLRARVEKMGLSERVTFVGDLDALALRAEYLRADVYVSTSSVDGTSISLLEAMACSVPAFVTRIPGNAQWITDDTGWAFDVGDVEGLVALLRAWLQDPTVRREAVRRAARARARVRETADWDATVRRLPQLAERAIQRHRAKAGGGA